MKVSTGITALIIFSFALIGMYAFLSDLVNDNAYDIEYDDKYLTELDNAQNISASISTSWDKAANFSAKKSTLYQFVTLVPDALSVIKDLFMLPPKLVASTVASVTQFIGLPEWVGSFVLSIFMTAFIFAFIALILRYKYV